MNDDFFTGKKSFVQSKNLIMLKYTISHIVAQKFDLEFLQEINPAIFVLQV